MLEVQDYPLGYRHRNLVMNVCNASEKMAGAMDTPDFTFLGGLCDLIYLVKYWIKCYETLYKHLCSTWDG